MIHYLILIGKMILLLNILLNGLFYSEAVNNFDHSYGGFTIEKEEL